jgi:hypothetical protein
MSWNRSWPSPRLYQSIESIVRTGTALGPGVYLSSKSTLLTWSYNATCRYEFDYMGRKSGSRARTPFVVATGTWLSGRAPLLAPSPLRTGLEGFPSSGSSTQKRALKKRGRGQIQNESNKACSILACCRFARRWRIHQLCGKPHQRLMPLSFALLPSSVPQEFSS